MKGWVGKRGSERVGMEDWLEGGHTVKSTWYGGGSIVKNGGGRGDVQRVWCGVGI